MTIHSDHPFATPDGDKDDFRRLRGRLPGPATVVATGAGRSRAGLTVSSVLLVDGPEPSVIALVDPDSDLGEALVVGAFATLNVLEPGDDFLAEVFAAMAPAPGGMFTVGSWIDSDWGPHLAERSWCGFTVTQVRHVGWSVEVTGTVADVGVVDATGVAHARGRFHDLR